MHAPTVKTILLLDDEPAVLQIAAIILRATGQWHVLEARSLQEATEQTQSHVDLVIADLCVDEHGPAAVAKVQAPVDLLAGYYHAVHKLTLEFVAGVTAEDLERIVDRNWDPPVTASARIVSIIDDCAQHLGQAAYLLGIAP